MKKAHAAKRQKESSEREQAAKENAGPSRRSVFSFGGNERLAAPEG
jgi:hypothetical protein